MIKGLIKGDYMKTYSFNKKLRVFIVVIFFALVLFSNKGTIRVTAAVSTPKVSIVSLDHVPFLEGDTNQFFYTCETTMGDKWLTNLTEYGKSIDYTLNKLPEGPYIVDIWAKTDTSTNKYDGWKLSIINIKKETIPTVNLVSLDHQPFVSGDNNSFYVVSKNYTGKVQYQFFYICEATMGNK